MNTYDKVVPTILLIAAGITLFILNSGDGAFNVWQSILAGGCFGTGLGRAIVFIREKR